ncbi:tetratricopeptide repeat protein [Micromonospora sp. HUAS LYJ1]|uniref:tetratricopeptide repeat protein n=1 Tax=Micromonospora sp. HUAS LYJ1 TaxID=3061626 RepID=UPI002670EE07|nr:tetratricopeptide repeat protein [Micromonospora sp. HUAS LYJ1]WKU05633.1 tetratricopeptide repeat protein [Micromonospora sp. HUAS LYJ1]
MALPRTYTWITAAHSHTTTAAPATDTGDDPVVLPDGLLHCRFCQQPMTPGFTTAGLVYDCPPRCRRPPLNAGAVTHAVGQVVLRYAAHLVPALTHPKQAGIAATHAHRLVTRITAGAHPADLRITWPAAGGQPRHALAEELRLARQVATTDTARTYRIVQSILVGVDPATTATTAIHAEAAHLFATLLTGAAAVRWADHAHRSLTHLHGPTHPYTLTAAHTLATAHRQAGHHQRAYRLYRQLAEHLAVTVGAEHLAVTVGADAHQTLAVRATSALVLHDLGHHEAARTLLADVVSRHGRAHPGHPATARMTDHLNQLRRDAADPATEVPA